MRKFEAGVCLVCCVAIGSAVWKINHPTRFAAANPEATQQFENSLPSTISLGSKTESRDNPCCDGGRRSPASTLSSINKSGMLAASQAAIVSQGAKNPCCDNGRGPQSAMKTPSELSPLFAKRRASVSAITADKTLQLAIKYDPNPCCDGG